MQIEAPGECCGALMFFDFNETSKAHLFKEMENRASRRRHDEDDSRRTIFAIVSNRQQGLKETLEDIGFDAIYDFIGTYVWADELSSELTMMVYNQQEKGPLPIWKEE